MRPIKSDPRLIKLFAFSFILYFITFTTIGGFTGKVILILLSLPCSTILSIITIYIVEKGADFIGSIYWTSKKISPREQLSADLEKARHSKRNNRFEESLDIINHILNKDNNFPDALYLKAKILWEGFGRSVESKNLFRRVMELVSADNPLYRWSSYYIDKITEKDKMRVAEFNAEKE